MVVIGNAPTALFHLLDMLDAGAPRPAVILGFPVGFIGAAESKALLAAEPRRAVRRIARQTWRQRDGGGRRERTGNGDRRDERRNKAWKASASASGLATPN